MHLAKQLTLKTHNCYLRQLFNLDACKPLFVNMFTVTNQ